MTNKRILLIHNDRLLLKLYREKLEESGFVVDATRDLDQVAKVLANRKPDIVLLSLVFPRGNALEFVTSLRKQPLTAAIPILVLPNALTELGNAAINAGATKTVAARNNPIGSVVNAIKNALGMPDLGNSAEVAFVKPEEFWVQSIVSTALDSINQMRHCLPGLNGTPPELPVLRELWSLVHAFAEKAQFLPYEPLAQFTAALDMLLHDLNETPEQLNPSTLRTLGQALDFLASVVKQPCLQRLTDPSKARVLVVDDEQSARQFISAALQLAGLNSDTAASPSMAIQKLTDHHSDLIFLDVGLPEMNGFDLCAKIRAIDNHKSTPIVFITGMATFHNKAKANLSGGNDFIGKPFNLPELGVKGLIWLYRGQLAIA